MPNPDTSVPVQEDKVSKYTIKYINGVKVIVIPYNTDITEIAEAVKESQPLCIHYT